MKRVKPLSGAMKLRASGRRAIMVAVTPAEMDKLRRAADRTGRKLSAFLRHYAIEAANGIIALGPK